MHAWTHRYCGGITWKAVETTSLGGIEIIPLVGCSVEFINFIIVLLPDPFWPIIVTLFPFRILKLTSDSIGL